MYLEDFHVGQRFESGAHTIDAVQIKAFAGLYPHDVRPLQPLNGRVVKETR